MSDQTHRDWVKEAEKKRLLRSSGQPAATQEELLRATQAGTIDPKVELLRAEQRRSDSSIMASISMYVMSSGGHL